MALERVSPCKINLILNILGKRPDGFHELETLMCPVQLHDRLVFETSANGIELSCNIPELPVDSGNLVYRAADAFLRESGVNRGVRIHLEKKIPLAAGMGGGSSNAANTLLGLNELFHKPLGLPKLTEIAASLGSDVPFFLQSNAALAFGRGENVESLPRFKALEGAWLFLMHPGFGVSTPWAYKNLGRFPEDLNGTPGRARQFAEALIRGDLAAAKLDFYNSLESPVFDKHPILAMFKEFLLQNGATISMMSGSGSTTFAIAESKAAGESLAEKFRNHFRGNYWFALVPMQ